MRAAILIPSLPAPAIEERHTHLQTRLLLSRGVPGATIHEYAPEERASDVATRISAEMYVIATDPLIATSSSTVRSLVETLDRQSRVDAVVASLNASANPAQVRAVEPYLTLRQLEAQTAGAEQGVSTAWDATDPVLYAARKSVLASSDATLDRLLERRDVLVDRSGYVHRFASMRGQLRADLLELVSRDAKAILEFGCGEGALGAALKERQQCRVTGIEMEEDAAAVARQRLDSVLTGDVRTLIPAMTERFDFIVGGDIVEHLDDPWTFLRELRSVAAPKGRLLLSLPNLSCWPVIEDLLAGRFDYVYMGITCVGHLRFFTRKTIEDLLAIAGWKKVDIVPQPEFATAGFAELEAKLKSAGINYSREDLLPTGWYVIAENS